MYLNQERWKKDWKKGSRPRTALLLISGSTENRLETYLLLATYKHWFYYRMTIFTATINHIDSQYCHQTGWNLISVSINRAKWLHEAMYSDNFQAYYFSLFSLYYVVPIIVAKCFLIQVMNFSIVRYNQPTKSMIQRFYVHFTGTERKREKGTCSYQRYMFLHKPQVSEFLPKLPPHLGQHKCLFTCVGMWKLV